MIEQATGGTPTLVGSVRFDERQRPRNSLFAVIDGGAIGGVYDKWHLVPFGEYVPDWLPLPIMVVPGGGFASGPGPRTLQVPGLPPFGALICYEAIFPGQVVERDNRPAWLVNVTNDAWFGNSTGPRQHLAAARMRAVEEGLPLLRAANTGISAAFDARGRELGRLDMQQTGTLAVALPGAAGGDVVRTIRSLVAGPCRSDCTRYRSLAGRTHCSARLTRVRPARISCRDQAQNLYNICYFDVGS